MYCPNDRYPLPGADFLVENERSMRAEQTQPIVVTRPSRAQSPANKGARFQAKRNGTLIALFLGAALLGVLIGAVLIGAPYAYYQTNGLIVPGVQLANLDLGGLSREHALAGLAEIYPSDLQVHVTDGVTIWQAQASEFGLSWNASAMVQQGLNIGHGKDVLEELEEMFLSFTYGRSIQPVLNFDPEIAALGLENWSQQVSTAPIDAVLTIEGGLVQVSQPQAGAALNFDLTLSELAANPQAFLEGRAIQLYVDRIPPRVRDLSQAASQAKAILDLNVPVEIYDPITDEAVLHQVDRSILADWLEIIPEGDSVRIEVPEEKILAYFSSLSTSLGQGRYLQIDPAVEQMIVALKDAGSVNLRALHAPSSYEVQPGDTLLKIGWNLGIPFWMLYDANPFLNSDGLQTGQTLTIPSKDELLPFPVVRGKRVVIGIGEQKLWVYEQGELIHEYVISTGIDRSPTQPGTFQVQTHDLSAYASVWDLTMPHFMGIYEAWPGFMNGIHGLPTLSNGRTLWADVLGKPASYGCIILELDAAELLFEWAEEGVVVEIIE
jgi:hypothetical protein